MSKPLVDPQKQADEIIHKSHFFSKSTSPPTYYLPNILLSA